MWFDPSRVFKFLQVLSFSSLECFPPAPPEEGASAVSQVSCRIQSHQLLFSKVPFFKHPKLQFSGILSPFKLLCPHHQPPSPECFSFLKEKLCPHETLTPHPSPFLLVPTLLPSASVSLPTPGISSGVTQYLSYGICFFHLAQCFQGLSMLLGGGLFRNR